MNKAILFAVKSISAGFDVGEAEIIFGGRDRVIGEARIACYYLLNECTNMTTIEIAKQMGKKSHASVIHGRNRVIELMSIDRKFSEKLRLSMECFCNYFLTTGFKQLN